MVPDFRTVARGRFCSDNVLFSTLTFKIQFVGLFLCLRGCLIIRLSACVFTHTHTHTLTLTYTHKAGPSCYSGYSPLISRPDSSSDEPVPSHPLRQHAHRQSGTNAYEHNVPFKPRHLFAQFDYNSFAVGHRIRFRETPSNSGHPASRVPCSSSAFSAECH